MKVYINIILILLLGCSGTKHSFLDEVQIRFDKGKELYESEKFTRAKEELQFVVMNNPGTQMALDAQYLLGESHFQLKEFDEAGFEFDRFSRFSQNYNKIEKARYRICECAINMSNPFEKDQINTFTAIDRLQEFIEDYPTSMKLDEATNQISMLRLKLAKKEFESARLYMKLEEYGSALIYLNNVLSLYYDTKIVDDVRLSIIFIHLLRDDINIAKDYLKTHKNKFNSNDKIKEAENLISKIENGSFGFTEYYRLYK